MRVTYYGAQGQVRMVYLNVASHSELNYKSVVELLSVEKFVNTEAGKETLRTPGQLPTEYLNFDRYSTMAIINLAPGEYLEWSKDAERS